MQETQYMVCPQKHEIPMIPQAYGKDFSSGDMDAVYGLPMYEDGLYCYQCKDTYGMSRLVEKPKKPEGIDAVVADK